jgi:hypothetical protein
MYDQWLPQLMPPRLRGRYAKVLLTAMGRELDETAERVRQGVLQRYPEFASDSALNVIGRSRMLERDVGESTADYAARLGGARLFWEKAGTDAGMLKAIELLGYNGFIHPWSAPRQSEFDITLTPGRRTWTGSAFELSRIVRIIRRMKKGDSELYRIFYTSQTTFPTWGQPGLTWGQVGLTWGAGRTEIYVRP